MQNNVVLGAIPVKWPICPYGINNVIIVSKRKCTCAKKCNFRWNSTKKNYVFLKKPEKIDGRWIITLKFTLLKLPCFISFTYFPFPSLPSVIKVQMDLMCIFKNFKLHYCFDLSKHKRKIIQHGKVQIKKILCRPLNLWEISPLHL